jgi:hypothetical protein
LNHELIIEQQDGACRILKQAQGEMRIAEENMARCNDLLNKARQLVIHWDQVAANWRSAKAGEQ